MVQKGKFSASMPARVSALRSVDLPTFGSPTMPQWNPISAGPALPDRTFGRLGQSSAGIDGVHGCIEVPVKKATKCIVIQFSGLLDKVSFLRLSCVCR